MLSLCDTVLKDHVYNREDIHDICNKQDTLQLCNLFKNDSLKWYNGTHMGYNLVML